MHAVHCVIDFDWNVTLVSQVREGHLESGVEWGDVEWRGSGRAVFGLRSGLLRCTHLDFVCKAKR